MTGNVLQGNAWVIRERPPECSRGPRGEKLKIFCRFGLQGVRTVCSTLY